MLERPFLQRNAVDERAVAALQVPDLERLPFLAD